MKLSRNVITNYALFLLQSAKFPTGEVVFLFKNPLDQILVFISQADYFLSQSEHPNYPTACHFTEWIHMLGSLHPMGLNVDFNMIAML